MRSALSCVVLLAVALAGCDKPADVAPPVGVAAPDASARVVSKRIEGLPVTLTAKQRSTIPVPGSQERLSLTVDDVTRGQVMVSLLDQAGSAFAGPRSMAVDETWRFPFGDANYTLRLTELSNSLIGDDFATFEIADDSEIAGDSPSELTEQDKIERLISAIEALDEATFVRNGTEHSAHDAAKHLRRKMAATDVSRMTATDFLEQIASTSSLTGEDYLIRTRDGQTSKAREFLLRELENIEEP